MTLCWCYLNVFSVLKICNIYKMLTNVMNEILLLVYKLLSSNN